MFQPAYGLSSDLTEALISQGFSFVTSATSKGLSAASARKMEQEKRKTAKATSKRDQAIEASKAKAEEARAKAAAAEAAARQAEADAASRAQITQYATVGLVLLAAVGAGYMIVQARKENA